LKIFALFLCLFLFIGAVYGMVVSFYLSIKNHKKIKKEFSKKFNEKKRFFYFNIIIGFIFMLSGFFDSLFFILGFLFFIFPYFYFYGKAIEEICMVKKINTKYLTEGDWLYKDIKLNKKIIFADWDGLNKKQIKEIQKNYQEIKIKQGIAFVPVFLISFLVLISLYFFNLNLWNSFW
jgi:purine-cytosine permease-like protein